MERSVFCSSEGRSRLETNAVRHPAEFVIEVVGFNIITLGENIACQEERAHDQALRKVKI